MLRKMMVAVAISTLVGCSSAPVVQDQMPIKAEFMGGNVIVTYDKNGQLELLESKSSARVVTGLPNAVDESFLVASLKARNQIAEFMKVDVESETFTDTIFDSLQNANNSVLQNSQNIARKVQNNIRQKTSAILKGTFVSKKEYDESSRTVRVTVQTSAKDVNVAKQVRVLMEN